VTKRKQYDLPPGCISSASAALIVGVDVPLLLRWARTGLVHPTRYTGLPGDKSSAYAWRVPEIIAARTIRKLREQGLPLQKVRLAEAAIRRAGDNLASVVLWSDGGDAFRVFPGDQLVSVVSQPGQHMIFPISDWAAEVRQEYVVELEKLENTKAG
jgi:hypothetical protein